MHCHGWYFVYQVDNLIGSLNSSCTPLFLYGSKSRINGCNLMFCTLGVIKDQGEFGHFFYFVSIMQVSLSFVYFSAFVHNERQAWKLQPVLGVGPYFCHQQILNSLFGSCRRTANSPVKFVITQMGNIPLWDKSNKKIFVLICSELHICDYIFILHGRHGKQPKDLLMLLLNCVFSTFFGWWAWFTFCALRGHFWTHIFVVFRVFVMF